MQWVFRKLFFPVFDWLFDRGWLSYEGTWRDYLVVLAVGSVYGIPVGAPFWIAAYYWSR